MSLTRAIRRNKVRLQIDEYNEMADNKNVRAKKTVVNRIAKPSRVMSHIWRHEVMGK